MRLPKSMTDIAPAGAVLAAEEAGEALLAQAVADGNDRLFIADADEAGLSRWEKDFGLADWSGVDVSRRRARLRGALAGGQTLTRERLRALPVTVIGAEAGEVEEDFGNYSAALTAIFAGRLPDAGEMRSLSQAVERQKPAHLHMTLYPGAGLHAERGETQHGGVLREVWGNA